jgi:holo-[acyl-carrier protein] synthase
MSGMTFELTHFAEPTSTVIHLGTDLLYIPRLSEPYARFGIRFLARFLTSEELAYCRGQAGLREAVFLKRIAGRIAVKEATSKALGTGMNGLGWAQGVYWRNIEVISQPQSPPDLVLTGRALAVSAALGIRCWRMSLSHDGDYAMATVMGLASR